MIRRNCRSLLWFGAVAAAVLFALPALADEIEPEPYVEEEAVEPEPEPEPEPVVEAKEEEEVAKQRPPFIDEYLDLMIMRPFLFATTLVGAAVFVPAAVMASPSGAEGIREAWETFVVPSYESTFKRPLGEP